MRIRRERLRELRTLRNLTKSQVAVLLDCSRSAVSTWETTGGAPRPRRLRALAELLDVKVIDLIETSGPLTLKDLRLSAGMRQCDVAAGLPVAVSTYCDVETGRQKIPARWVPKLADMWGVPESAIRQLSGSAVTRKQKEAERE